MAKISIIIPVYNSAETLKRCVNSIRMQTFSDIEIILVNDGSKDDSKKICDEVGDIDKRITVLHKENGGVSSARNAGLNIANSQYVMFVDSDDYIEPKMCEKLYNKLSESLVETVLCGYTRIFTNKNRIIRSYNIEPNCNDLISLDMFKKCFGQLYEKALFNAPWGKIYSLSIINENGIRFDENFSFGEDLMFNLEYFKYVSKVAVINMCLYNYECTEKESLTRKFDIKKFDNYKYLLHKTIEFCDYKGIYNECANYIHKIFIRGCFICMEQIYFDGCGLSTKDKYLYVKDIINQREIKEVIYHRNRKDLEFFVYWCALKTRLTPFVMLMVWIRLYIKRKLRGV